VVGARAFLVVAVLFLAQRLVIELIDALLNALEEARDSLLTESH